ncbi:MAG: type II toxin-antitoxin system HipA family toxin [Bacteroidales bacterium]|nr:type II toxin-antitoxin system HipA family toxin [Bacteroidales bacterium]
MSKIFEIGKLSVLLWGKEIGQLSWNSQKRNSYFFFSKDYLSSGMDIAPIVASSRNPESKFAIFGDIDNPRYQKLPPFIADSLPDDWGNTLFDQWFAENHYHEKDKTPLAKLSFVGKRAMGALEFVPCSEGEFNSDEKLMIPKLYDLAVKIEKDRDGTKISSDESLTQKALMAIGTSAGGRFKKAIIAMDEDGNIYSGQTSTDPERKYYILKFNTPEFCISETEMTWYEMAINAGISMMPSRLIKVEGVNHFITERFDRQNGKKVFTQTLAAVNPEAYCYEDLFSTCRVLSIPMSEQSELFLRMVFNVLAGNTDDHAKNFSFIMDKDGKWHISPAYDLTFILKNAASAQRSHVFSIRGKHDEITLNDLRDFAVQNSIKNPDKYIDQVKAALKDFRGIAQKNGIAPYFIKLMENRLRELSPDVFTESEEINDSRIRIEPTDSGNLHLYAVIEGKTRRRVFTPKDTEYDRILEVMTAKLTAEQEDVLIRTYFS